MTDQGVLKGLPKPRIVAWFSCGDASAVATKLALSQYGDTHEIAIAYCVIPDEHPDNERFVVDAERWFGQPILRLRSMEFKSVEEVWRKRRFMSSPKGAPCTIEMKKAVRWAFEKVWHPDFQVFGFTEEERGRADRFRVQNPEIRLITPLIEHRLMKEDCHAIIARAAIALPMMYTLGFENNNCIGCVKASSPTYWNRVRRQFPDVFDRRAKLSREIGCKLVRGTKGNRERYFLDELHPEEGAGETEPKISCSPLCEVAELEING